MGEAMMFRFGSGSGGNYNLVTEIIKENTTFTVPYNIKDNAISVRIFGGGGAGALSGGAAGGGGGWMNNATINVTPGQTIPIIIGDGGVMIPESGSTGYTSGSGGTTSFGTYLSAAGGTGGSVNKAAIGGNGGSGGGAWYLPNSGRYTAIGGIGYQFGGGGAIAANSIGGNGGKWGGGGGAYECINNYKSNYTDTLGIGGEFGGNGGLWKFYGNGMKLIISNINAENGTNTINNKTIDSYYWGAGLRGVLINNTSSYYLGGGGGFGGNGGNGFSGGGGGYGASGGNGSYYEGAGMQAGAGGGGGYGRFGCGGDAVFKTAGGGGAYGPGGSFFTMPKDGGGGCGGISNSKNVYNGHIFNFRDYINGASGICIIQYYQKV